VLLVVTAYVKVISLLSLRQHFWFLFYVVDM